MKKSKIKFILAGIIISLSSVILVIFILIASGTVSLDNVFSEEKVDFAPLYEMNKSSFYISYEDDMYLSIDDIQCSFAKKEMYCVIDFVNSSIYDCEITKIVYDITDDVTTYSGAAEISGSVLGDAGRTGKHKVSFDVWHDYVMEKMNFGRRSVTITVYYINPFGELSSCSAKTVF